MNVTKSMLIVGLMIIQLGAQAQHYIVEITASPDTWKSLQKSLNGIDHFRRNGNQFTLTLHHKDIEKAQQLGAKTRIVKGPLEQEIQHRITHPTEQKSLDTLPPFFHKGSLLGNLSYSEAMGLLDTLHLTYPNLCSSKIEYGKSLENRALYYYRISNTPPSSSKNFQKPAVLFTSLHHAREPLSMMQMLYFMCDFLSKASPESEQMALLNSVDLYFVPFVNPDGYLYNESQKLSGNVFWRKNRRDNLDGSFGVDLNRNYDAYWGYDESGSSSDPSSDLYRGESAFSEPETQALKSLSEQLNPLGVLNFHSYGNYVLYSYAYQDGAYAKDDINLRSIAESITAENQYVYGTSWEVLYAVNGGADDWQYDRNFLSPTLSFTPEVGEAEEGFWPSEEKIIPYCKDNLFLNYEFVQRMTLLTDGIKEHSKQAIVYIQQGQLYSQTAGNIRLYSILGQELLNTNIQNGISLNLNAYKGQLVLVELINPQGKFTQKVYVN